MPIVAISVMNILTTLASFHELDRLVIQPVHSASSASAQYCIWNFGVVIGSNMIRPISSTPLRRKALLLLSGEMIAVLGLSGVLAVFVAWWV
ncbi:phosphoethanolamine transferase domain-containing protein [Klebsiella pneumoniae]|nr:phosphoethanolamine transferase domain-containing protein [Klebsiella pneumoniae]